MVSYIDETALDGQLFRKLQTKLSDGSSRYKTLHDYYSGDAPLPHGPRGSNQVFRDFQKKARANWAELVVDATRERLEPTGFRTGADGDELGDKEARRIWQANNLDAESTLIHQTMLAQADSYAIVGDIDPEIGAPLITAEDPLEVVTLHDPARRRRVTSALKVWEDPSGDRRAVIYVPGGVRMARSVGGTTWAWDDEWTSLPAALANDVPVVRFANRRDLRGNSRGEFETVIDDIDRINLMILQRLTVAVYQAFRQRAVKGLPMKDNSGQSIDWSGAFDADPGSLWALPPGADLWESGGVDLTPILESVKADIRDLAARTRTPMFYLFPDAANGSAEGASLQREGLVFKCRDRIRAASEPWEQVMSLAFKWSGDLERAARPDMECVWSPPERFSLSEKMDAASKATAAGVPWSTVMSEIMQFSPQQIERMTAERASDLLLTASFDAN